MNRQPWLVVHTVHCVGMSTNHVLETGPLVLKYYHKSIICPVNSLANPFIFDSEVNIQRSQVWSQGFVTLLA